jgi:hypothetical protein
MVTTPVLPATEDTAVEFGMRCQTDPEVVNLIRSPIDQEEVPLMLVEPATETVYSSPLLPTLDTMVGEFVEAFQLPR